MLLKLTFAVFLTCQIFSICSSSLLCTFICLNQTNTALKAPPIYINDSTTDVLIFFSINCTSNGSVTYANVSIAIDNPRSIEIKNSLPLNLLQFNGSENLTFDLIIHGNLLGYSQLSLHVEYLNEQKFHLNSTDDLQIDFAVKRKSTVLDTIFTVIVIILVCIGTFLIGCRLVTQNLYANIRRPVPILIGLSSQFLCLPLVRIKRSNFIFFFVV